MEPAFFQSLNSAVRSVVAALARRGVRRTLTAQGYGRHGRDGVYRLGAADLAALACILRRSEFAAGSRPSSYDAALYGVLANIVTAPIDTELKDEARRHSVLVEYVDRIRSLTGSR